MSSATDTASFRAIRAPHEKDMRLDPGESDTSQRAHAAMTLQSMRVSMAAITAERRSAEAESELDAGPGPGHISRAHEAVRPDGLPNWAFYSMASAMGREALEGRVPTEAIDSLATDMGITSRLVGES